MKEDLLGTATLESRSPYTHGTICALLGGRLLLHRNQLKRLHVTLRAEAQPFKGARGPESTPLTLHHEMFAHRLGGEEQES